MTVIPFASGAVKSPSPDPAWPYPVDGGALLDEIASAVSRYVYVTKEQADAVALWIISTWTIDTATFAPRLAITSAEKQSGKTTLLDVLSQLVRSPLSSGSLTAPAVFRSVEVFKPTLLIDEADTFLKDKPELVGVLNQGHRRGGHVIRCVGNDWTPKLFDVFCTAAIACIGTLPETLEDRSIKLAMRRATREEKPAPLRIEDRTCLQQLNAKCCRWARDNSNALKQVSPEIPDWLSNRAGDNWEPLLAVATQIGGKCVERAHAAAQALSQADPEASMSDGVLLLADIRITFEAHGDKLSSAFLCEQLKKEEHRPWPALGAGKGISPSQLAALLKPFGIRPKNIRVGAQTPKGYEFAQFEDAFRRYLPPKETPHRHNGEIP